MDKLEIIPYMLSAYRGPTPFQTHSSEKRNVSNRGEVCPKFGRDHNSQILHNLKKILDTGIIECPKYLQNQGLTPLLSFSARSANTRKRRASSSFPIEAYIRLIF